MKRWMLRAGFVSVLVAALLIRQQAIALGEQFERSFDPTTHATLLLESEGFTLLQNPVSRKKIPGVNVYFQRAGCERKSAFVPFSIATSGAERFSRLGLSEYDVTFRFLDREWATQPRMATFVKHFANVALSAVGATTFIPSKEMILIADPKECEARETIAWSRLWKRNDVTLRSKILRAAWQKGS